MIKQLGKNDTLLSPFITEKAWSLYNTNPEELILTETTGSEEPVALEYLDWTSGSPILNRDCNIALEQQSTDLAIPEEGVSGSGKFFPSQEEINTKTGTYKRLLYDQIYRAFYNDYNNPLKLFGMENIDFPLSNTNRFLGNEFVMFTIPRLIFGERLKERSIYLYDQNLDDDIEIVDDGEGNLLAHTNLFSKVQEVRSFGNTLLPLVYFYYAEYNPLLATFADAGNLPVGMGSIPLYVGGGKIYLFGANQASVGRTDVIYTASVDSPEIVGDSNYTMPTTASNWMLLEISGTLYQFGGTFSGNTNMNSRIYTASAANPLVWGDSGADLPAQTFDGQAKIIGDKIWIFWGRQTNGAPFAFFTSSMTASTSNPLQFGIAGNLNAYSFVSSVVQIGDSLYSYGGLQSGTGFNPSNRLLTASISNPKVWVTASALAMPGGERAFVAVGEKMYSFGGIASSSALSNQIYEISPESPLAPVRTSYTIPIANWYSAGIAITSSAGTPYIALYGGGNLLSTVSYDYIHTCSVSITQSQSPSPSYLAMNRWQVLNGDVLTYQSKSFVCPTASVPVEPITAPSSLMAVVMLEPLNLTAEVVEDAVT